MKADSAITIMRRHPQFWYYALLICAVTVSFAGSCSWMLAHGYELVWTQDALPLYANFLTWGRRALASSVNSLTAGLGLELPQYTYNMGYGADVPMTMGSYLQDPINLVALALPESWVGLSYSLMVYLRAILAAIAFSVYCFAHGNGRKATGVAALAYATCGFLILLGAFRHPKFMDWAVLLPLILLGADRIFQKKSPVLFVAAMFLQFFVSIYFSYMSCIVVLVYCLMKYFLAPRQRSTRDFATLVATFLFYGLLAFLLCGIFALPQITALLSQGRATSGGSSVPLLFTLKYYLKIPAHFIGAAGTTEGMVVGGVSTIGLLGFLLCGKRFEPGRRRPWLWGFLLCFAGVLVPFFGHVMNGMGYSTDRWMLVLVFVCSYILCTTIPLMPRFSSAEWKRVTIAALGVFAITCVYGAAQLFLVGGLKEAYWPLVMAALFIVVYFVAKRLASSGKATGLAAFCGGAVIICSALTCTFYCSPLGMNWGSSFPEAGSTWKSLTVDTPAAAAEKTDDADLWRYTVPRVYDSMKNSALAHDVMGVDYYTSFYNQNVDDLRQSLGISDHHMNFSFVGSDSRLAIEDLAGVKYYVCKKRDFWRVPYGFEDTGIEFNGYKVFKNANAVPLGFLMPETLDKKSYDELSMTQKQEALLQAAVLESDKIGATSEISKSDLSFASEAIDFKILETRGMELDMENGVAHVYEKSATVTLGFDGLEQSETYLSFKNLGFEEYSPSTLQALQGKEVTIASHVQDVLWTRSTTYPITASSGDRTKTSNPATPEHLRYGGKTDWIFNLCYSDEALHEMTIEFDERGDYTFDELQVICQPVKPVVDNARKLAQSSVSKLELGSNSISAEAELRGDEPQIAVFTFAYTPGWSVTVDGQPAEALKVDTAFIGVEIEGAGKHSIEWSYTTPGLSTGACLTVIGLALCGLALLVRLLAKRRPAHQSNG